MAGAHAPGPPIERVRIERRGGLAGLCPSVECAYAALSGREQAALHRVLAGHDVVVAAPGADRFSYRLKLAHAGGAGRTLDIAEDAMPAALARLVKPTPP